MFDSFSKTYSINLEGVSINEEKTLDISPFIPYLPKTAPYYCKITNPFFLTTVEYTDWRDESLAWQFSCVIHAGLNPAPAVIIKGPEAVDFLKKYLINNFDKFPVGSSKHGIMCAENGKVASSGVLMRTAEDTFEAHWLSPFINSMFENENYKAELEDITDKHFIFQLFGPKSLEILEEASGDNLHDIKFCRFREISICSKKVRILRFGMTNGLAYEVHGNVKDTREIYFRLLQAGKTYGIRQLGHRAYMLSHTPGGCQQFALHYVPALFAAPGGSAAELVGFVGSAGTDISKRIMNPFELGLGKVIDFNHDFIGKKALEEYKANQRRTMVTLEWNAEDIGDITASQFRDKEPFFPMDEPGQLVMRNGLISQSMDIVLDKNDKEIGISGGRTVSCYHRAMLSLASIDLEYTKLGTEVSVLWGDAGTRQKKIRAKVAPLPYNTNYENKTYNVELIPYQK